MGLKAVVLYASVGYGNKDAADALCEWYSAIFPSSEAVSRDMLDYLPRPLRGGVVSAFNATARRAPWLWERIYRDTDIAAKKHIASAFWNDIHKSVGSTCLRHLFKDLNDVNPDVVFVTHIFGMPALLDKWEHRTPIYFVGSDYLTNPLQRDPRFDGWFVGSDEAVRQYKADNVPTAEYSVKNFGIPVSRDYIVPPTRDEARRTLGMDEREKMITVINDGIGTPSLDAVVGSLIELSEWKIFVVCRGHAKTYEYLRDKYFPFKHITVKDSAKDAAFHYAASDMVVIGPSGVRITEASVSGAAILLLDPLPGLERYNCDYVLERGMARKIYEYRRVGEFVRELMEKRDELDRMRYRARVMSRSGAAMDILTWAAEKAEAEKRRI
jgi:processive 1,2-diacylglycerol beta-glucosyltransferase